MIKLIKSILDTIGIVIGLLISIIKSLVNFIINIPKYLQFLIATLSIAPTFTYQFAIAFLSITIILFLLNRKSNATGGD